MVASLCKLSPACKADSFAVLVRCCRSCLSRANSAAELAPRIP